MTFLSVRDTLFKRNIEMTPLRKIEATLPRVLGSREVRLGGVVDGAGKDGLLYVLNRDNHHLAMRRRQVELQA